MHITITGKNIDLTDGLKSAVEEKLGKLEKYFTEDTAILVTLSVEKERQKIEVTIPAKGNIIRSEQVSNDMYVSIDLVEEVIERQLKKYKKKIISKHQNASSFKKEFIEVDEFDRGERIKLNFAHTFGHAIETVTNYEVPHGTAVAIGMIMADYVSVRRGLLSENICKRAEKVLLQVIHVGIRLTDYPIENFIAAMRKDKKQTSENLTAVLMTDVARDLRIVNDVAETEVKDAVDYFQQLYDDNK